MELERSNSFSVMVRTIQQLEALIIDNIKVF